MQGLKRIKAYLASWLQENEEKDMLESILALMPGHVYWMNNQGFYLGCNYNQAKSAGLLSPKDIIGKKNADLPWNIHSPLLPQALDYTNQEVIKTGKSITLEEPAVLQDGTELMFLSNKTPLYNKKGHIIGMVGISMDISDRKKTEKELVLEKVKAEAANQAKTAFLNNMRHDIRTALAGIIGATDLLKNETDTEKIRKYTQGLNTAALELLQFLNAILESVRIASGDTPLYTEKFNLTEILENVISLHQPLALQKKLDLRLTIDKSIPKYLMGDSGRIYRIILELLANALKFTAEGEVNVIATLVKITKKSVVIKILVKDTGIGIPIDEQSELFAQFNRLTPSYQGIYKGRGLGLYLVKQFIEDLSAEIQVSSISGKGSGFVCIIPLKIPLLAEEAVNL